MCRLCKRFRVPWLFHNRHIQRRQCYRYLPPAFVYKPRGLKFLLVKDFFKIVPINYFNFARIKNRLRKGIGDAFFNWRILIICRKIQERIRCFFAFFWFLQKFLGKTVKLLYKIRRICWIRWICRITSICNLSG